MLLENLLLVIPDIQTISLYEETNSAIYVGRNVPKIYNNRKVICVTGLGLSDIAIIIESLDGK